MFFKRPMPGDDVAKDLGSMIDSCLHGNMRFLLKGCGCGRTWVRCFRVVRKKQPKPKIKSWKLKRQGFVHVYLYMMCLVLDMFIYNVYDYTFIVSCFFLQKDTYTCIYIYINVNIHTHIHIFWFWRVLNGLKTMSFSFRLCL